MINEVNVPEIIHLLYLGHAKLWLSVRISKNISRLIRMMNAKSFYADFITTAAILEHFISPFSLNSECLPTLPKLLCKMKTQRNRPEYFMPGLVKSGEM